MSQLIRFLRHDWEEQNPLLLYPVSLMVRTHYAHWSPLLNIVMASIFETKERHCSALLLQ
jgi:hypothetical protein